MSIKEKVQTQKKIEDHLAHYGVLGMKWGVRKGSSSVTKGKSAKGKKEKTKKPNVSKMTDDELRRRINRLNMEKQYKQLTAPKKNAAVAWVGKVVNDAAKETAKSYVAGHMRTGVESAGKYGYGKAKSSKAGKAISSKMASRKSK